MKQSFLPVSTSLSNYGRIRCYWFVLPTHSGGFIFCSLSLNENHSLLLMCRSASITRWWKEEEEGGGAFKVFAWLWPVKVLGVVVRHEELCAGDCHCESWRSRQLSVTPDIAPVTLDCFSHWALTPTHALYDSTSKPRQVISRYMWNAWIGSNCCDGLTLFL